MAESALRNIASTLEHMPVFKDKPNLSISSQLIFCYQHLTASLKTEAFKSYRRHWHIQDVPYSLEQCCFF
jgi:hypothetical protein